MFGGESFGVEYPDPFLVGEVVESSFVVFEYALIVVIFRCIGWAGVEVVDIIFFAYFFEGVAVRFFKAGLADIIHIISFNFYFYIKT